MPMQKLPSRRAFGLTLLLFSLAALMLCVVYQNNSWVSNNYQIIAWVSMAVGISAAGLMAERKVLKFVCVGLIALIITVGSISLLSM